MHGQALDFDVPGLGQGQEKLQPTELHDLCLSTSCDVLVYDVLAGSVRTSHGECAGDVQIPWCDDISMYDDTMQS